MAELIIKNIKVIEFYSKYAIDIEKINLMMINILENVILNLESNITKTLVSDVLQYVNIHTKNVTDVNLEFNNTIKNNLKLAENNQNSIIIVLTTIKNTIGKLHDEINNSIVTKFHNMKNSYVENTKLIFEKSSDNNIYKNLEEENENLKNKIILIINNILPKNTTQYTGHLETMKNFKEDMLKNIEQFKKTSLSNDKLQVMFIEKYNVLMMNLQNNIIDYYISLSENKIKNTLNEINVIDNRNFLQEEYISNELIKFLVQNKISLIKCQYENILLQQILLRLLPSAEININTNENGIDNFIIERTNKPKILLDNKNYHSKNIPTEDVDHFVNTVKNEDCSAILISQRTGITFKQNFEIDINNGNILIYIHKMNYNPNTLLIAFDIIDNLSEKFKDSQRNESLIISESSLIKINEQYQKFIIKKEEIIHQVNENAKNIISMIKTMELSELNYILSSNNISIKNSNDTTYKCNKCNVREFTSLKSLSNHKRHCNVKSDDDE